MPPRDASLPNAPVNSRRRWGFRITALLLAPIALIVLEGLCHLGGWGRPTDYDDPYVGFTEVHPLFVRNESGQAYIIPNSRRRFFRAESFPAKKSPDTFRVFVLGGSTVAGEPYEKETSLTTWLQLALRAAEPEKNAEVVNCGGISYASYRLIPILKECLNYQPDLFIVATGHNEFLEDRTYGQLKRAPAALRSLREATSTWRTLNLLRTGVARWRGSDDGRESQKRPNLGAEVQARLDSPGGLELYHRDPAWRESIVLDFENNLRVMAGFARRAGVPIIFVRESSNLRDSPPFKSEHRPGLTEDDLRRFDALVAEARGQFRHDLRHAAELLEQAVQIDGEHALTWYELGKCRDALRDYERARQAYWRAREYDVCPLRTIQPLEDVLRQVADELKIPLVDMHALLEAKSRTGMLGNDWLVDHIHPSIEGHQIVADALADEMIRAGWVHPRAEWQERKKAAGRQHFERIPPDYFTRGEQTLERLRGWAAGRAGQLPPDTE